MKRSGTAVWRGSGKEGSGTLSTPSGALTSQPYSAHLRFGDESGVNGTNPEELIAAAHAGCFTMKASFGFTGAGFVPDELRTEAVLTLEQQGVHWTIAKMVLQLDARIPGISDEEFHRIAADSKANCPVSKALSIPIELEARLHRD
jgi:osmotically inducible protein OsmC